MKKTILAAIFFFSIFSLNAFSQAGVGLQIIDSDGPIISLISPINNSGTRSGNFTISFSVSDASDVASCQFYLRNSLNFTNSTINKSETIYIAVNDLTIGKYNWSLNCTDSLGYSRLSGNYTFTVNSLLKFNGSTTNISIIDTRDISYFVLEILPYGTINFSQSVDLSTGYDLDSNVNISSNLINVNSGTVPVLNARAYLTLNGISFTDPRILRDGSACSSSICTEDTYNGGVFKFNVTQFSYYSSDENPVTIVTVVVTTSGGGGGGGAATQVVRLAKIEIILPQPIDLNLNDEVTVPVVLVNTGQVAINGLTLSGEIDSNYLTMDLDQQTVDLGLNDSATFFATFRSFANKSGRTEVTFTATAQSPALTTRGKLYIDIVEKIDENRTRVVEKIKFVADLFRNNPECLELKELLDQADEANKRGELQKALSLADAAINSCRQMLAYKGKDPIIENPTRIDLSEIFDRKYRMPLIVVVSFIILTLLVYLIARHRSGDLGSAKKVAAKTTKSSRGASEEADINRLLKRKI